LVTYWQGLPLAALPAPARRASCRDARMWRAACTNNSLALSTHTLVRSAKSCGARSIRGRPLVELVRGHPRLRPQARLWHHTYTLCVYANDVLMRRTPQVPGSSASGAGAFTSSCIEIDCSVRDRDAESGANRSRHQSDFAAMRSN